MDDVDRACRLGDRVHVAGIRRAKVLAASRRDGEDRRRLDDRRGPPRPDEPAAHPKRTSARRRASRPAASTWARQSEPRKLTASDTCRPLVGRYQAHVLGPHQGVHPDPAWPTPREGAPRCRGPRRCHPGPSPRSGSSGRRTRPRNAVFGRSYSSDGGPICSRRPADMTPTRSPIARASSWSWVTNSVVMPTMIWMRRISSRSWRRTLASSAESGSSRRSTLGSIASARASATRCCCPPDIWYG